MENNNQPIHAVPGIHIWTDVYLRIRLPLTLDRTFLILVLFCAMCAPAMAADPVAQLVSIKGVVEVQDAGGSAWAAAMVNQSLYAGDTIRTGADGKAAVLLADETQMLLNRNSQLQLKAVEEISGWERLKGIIKARLRTGSVYELVKGELWARNKNTDVNVNFNTPVVSAGIRGTEINIRINPDNSVNIAVLEGTIQASNSLGSLTAASGEEVVTVPGAAPRKVVLVQAQDTVQWTLTIPPIFGPHNFPIISADVNALQAELQRLQAASANLTGLPVADQLRAGQLLRDLGQTDEAITILQRVLTAAPGNSEAIAALGWALIDSGDNQAALTTLNRDNSPTLQNYLGRIIALSEQNRLVQASNVLQEALTQFPDDMKLHVMAGYLDILRGRFRQAQTELQALLNTNPEEATAWDLLALASVILGDNKLALNASDHSLQLNSQSPGAYIINSYAQQTTFDLDNAKRSLRQALSLETDNVTALINLAQLQFGSDETKDAESNIGTATSLAPDNYQILNLKGYIQFAQRRLDTAEHAFQASLGLQPDNPEAYMGLSLIHMRQGDVPTAMEEIAKATLLDPQRSLYLSYWGKMLYQVKRFDKALAVLDRAAQLDPNDPTPIFYRSIILRDLNRPVLAIRSLNQAIHLNDNRGVYRSRFLLDKDLAVKNVDLSKLYSDLGLQTWAQRTAIRSIKQDYLNYSGHLFYAGALSEQEDRDYGFSSEQLLARLLLPANNNSFNTFNDYTSFFEEPNIGGVATGEFGTQGTLNGNIIGFGSLPDHNLAWQGILYHTETDGWRDTNFDRVNSIAGIAKWQPTPRDGVMFTGSHTETRQGDTAYPRYEYDSPSDPIERQKVDLTRLELGWHHHFAPESDLLVYLARLDTDGFNRTHDFSSQNLLPTIKLDLDTLDENNYAVPYYQAQVQYMFRYRQHQLMLGTVQYWQDIDESMLSTTNVYLNDNIVIIPPGPGIVPVYVNGIPINFTPPVPFVNKDLYKFNTRSQSYYIHDIWQVSDTITLEGALYYDNMDNVNFQQGLKNRLAKLNPRLGLIWSPSPANTLRIAAFRYLLPFISSRTDPTETAGIAIFRNTNSGALNSELDIQAEHEWQSGMVSADLFFLNKEFNLRTLVNNAPILSTFNGKLKGIELNLNQLLLDFLGLQARYRFQDVRDATLPDANRNEHLLEFGLNFVRDNGLSGGIKQTWRYIDLDNGRINETIPITDLHLNYELHDKRGNIKLEVRNLFDDHFNWVTDRFVLKGRAPEREALGTISLNY